MAASVLVLCTMLVNPESVASCQSEFKCVSDVPSQATAYAAPDAGGAEPGEATTGTGRAVHKWAQTGPRNQPKRTPKSRR